MTRRLFALVLVVSVALTWRAGSTDAANAPEATVQNFYATLLKTMKSGIKLGPKGRFDALAPEIRRSFDLHNMAQMAVGPIWSRLSSGQKARVEDAFAGYTIATYASRFDSYSGERFAVTGERRTQYGTIVESRLVPSSGDPVGIDYLTRQNGTRWQIADVYLTGTVSQLATLRAQFAAVLSRNGVEGLIDSLNRKVAALASGSSAS